MTTPQDEQNLNQISSTGQDTVREQDKVQLILSYCPCLLPLIPFLTVKDSDFVKWHAKQGLSLTAVTVVASIVLTILSTILATIAAPLAIVGTLLSCALSVGFIGLSIMGIMKSLKGERWRIPVVSDLADKF
jgi:uncharacterized membrane protein